MASLYKKVINGRPYWYLREMGWVDGKPKMISERYLGTAAEIEALLDARQAAAMPERTRHLAFGDVAAAWGMLQELGVAAIIDGAAGQRRAERRRVGGHLPGAGGAEPAGRAVLETGVRGLVEDNRRGPVHQDRCRRAGSPPVLGCDARGHPGAAGAGVGADRGPDRAGLGRGRLQRGAGHDELRHVHRHPQWQGADRAARQGQAETRRPAAGGAGAGGDPGRGHSADLARLPRRPAGRHPVPGHDQPAQDPV